MWCEKLENGKYKFRDRYTDPVTGQSRIVSVTMDRNSKQAERIAREILRQKVDQVRPSTGTNLSDLIKLYLNEQQNTVKASTRLRNESCLGMILDVLGDIRIDKLTAGYIRQRFLASGKKHVTLNEYIARLKALMRWAYRNDYIDDIRFLDKLDKFSDTSKKEKVQDKFLERSELTKLIESMHDDVWRDLTTFLALSGLRFGEAAALTRPDIDLSRRVISVSKTYDMNNDIVTSPKTYNSEREVYMQDELERLCRRILLENKILYISELFFVKNGSRIIYDNYRIYLRKHSIKELGRSITPHYLRHTHASLLMEDGVDIDTISARLGHADSKVTREIYLHVTKKLEDQRNQQIKNIHLLGCVNQ